MGTIDQDELGKMMRKPRKRKPKEQVKSNRIAEILAERGMPQQELADLSEILPQHLSLIIQNKRKSISLPTALKISRALNLPVEDIFNY